MKRRILDTAEAVAGAAADAVAAAVRARPAAVLALPTGRTPIPLYDAMAARHEKGAIDLSGARGFNRGALYREDGVLVASAAQEGLIRRLNATA